MKKRLVFDYIKAAVNLYGVASKDLVVQVYNYHNPDDVIDASGIDEVMEGKSLKTGFVANEEGCFCHKDAKKLGLVDFIRDSQKDKPYYVPEAAVFLKFKDDSYIDRKDAFEGFKNYLIDHIGLTDDQAEKYCVQSYQKVRRRIRMLEIMDDLNSFDVSLKGEQADEFMQRLAVFMNQVRRWENGGLMPMELAVTGYHAVKQQLSKDTSMRKEAKSSDSIQIGRNDPCFCGSGKKYKKCHGLIHA